MTFADKTIDKVNLKHSPLTDKDRSNMALCMPLSPYTSTPSFPLANTDSDDAEAHDGAPAAIHIFGRRWDEERLLSLAQLITDALEKYTLKHGGKL